MINFLAWTSLVSIVIIIMILFYKLGKLKFFLIPASKLLFSLFFLWLGFLVFILFYDGYDHETLIILLISIAFFMGLLGYIIHSKQVKSYLKSTAWLIGTPIVIIIGYVAVAILTHDPIVPRPLTVHQLLTGYNIVYTHDGKLYQNDEFVMDLEEIVDFEEVVCQTCIHGQVDMYGGLYLFPSRKDYLSPQHPFYYINLQTKDVQIHETYDARIGHIRPILTSKHIYQDGYDLYIKRWQLINEELVYENNYGYLTQKNRGEGDMNNRGNYYWYNKNDDIRDGIGIPYSVLNAKFSENINNKSSLSIPDDGSFIYLNNLKFLGILDRLPVFQAQFEYGNSYISAVVHEDTILYTGISGAGIYNNSLYFSKDVTPENTGHFHLMNDRIFDIYKDGEKILGEVRLPDKSTVVIEEDVCRLFNQQRRFSLCKLGEEYYPRRKIFLDDEYYYITKRIQQYIGVHSVFSDSAIEYGMVSNTSSNREKVYGSDSSLVEKILFYNNAFMTIVGDRGLKGIFDVADLLLNGIWGDNHSMKDTLEYITESDTIFLREFDASGSIGHKTTPLVSGIDNFLGIYPTTPPENKDPNADINVGQLLMDTYFPQEAEPEEEVDEQALLFELLKQREVRLDMERDNLYSTGTDIQ